MKRRLSVLLAFLLTGVAGLIQPEALGAQSGLIEGDVSIDLLRGSIAGDLCMRDLREIGDTVTFALNRALSIKRLTGAEQTPIGITLESGGAAVRYTVRRDSLAVAAIEAGARPPLCMTYGGSMPVYDVGRGDYRHDDHSALIAFNGTSVRARGASRWVPAFIDPVTELSDEAVRFDLRIACEQCTQIYVNGNRPQAGPSAQFSSAVPRELLLLAGRLPVTRISGALIVGESVNPDSAAAFFSVLHEIQELEATYLGVVAPPLPDILRIDPLRQTGRGELWGFYSDPALSLLGATIPRLTEVLLGDSLPPRRNVYTFLAHELAHQYFGWTLGTETTQRDFFGEPFATFLELKAMRARFGDAEYVRAVRNLKERVLNGPEPVAPDLATQTEIEGSRYGSTPLLLLALESIIGEAQMQALLRALVSAPDEEKPRADLAYLQRLALLNGVLESDWQRWETDCLRTPLARNSCLRAVGE